jgi:hypothetical protein
MNTKHEQRSSAASPQQALIDLVARTELRDVEVIRQVTERKFGGAEGGPSPMPEMTEAHTLVEVFTPNGEIRDGCAFLVSLRVTWTPPQKPKEELAHAWVGLRLIYTFNGQKETIDTGTLRAFGDGVVRNQAWPFLRERVFTLSQLAGLPQIVLPLVQLQGPQPRVVPPPK